MTDAALLEPSRARRLKAETHAVHDKLDTGLMARDSFSSREGYAGFLKMQLAFHRDIAALYADPVLRTLLPGLAERQRLAAVEADAADLGLDLAETRPRVFEPGHPADLATALGWLYVAEGSNMGAAVLRKAVQKIGLTDEFGARHLAPAEEGPAAHWRAFVAGLDAVTLDEAGEQAAIEGARAAFAHVQALADADVL